MRVAGSLQVGAGPAVEHPDCAAAGLLGCRGCRGCWAAGLLSYAATDSQHPSSLSIPSSPAADLQVVRRRGVLVLTPGSRRSRRNNGVSALHFSLFRSRLFRTMVGEIRLPMRTPRLRSSPLDARDIAFVSGLLLRGLERRARCALPAMTEAEPPPPPAAIEPAAPAPPAERPASPAAEQPAAPSAGPGIKPTRAARRRRRVA
jgi:hypothetical protein